MSILDTLYQWLIDFNEPWFNILLITGFFWLLISFFKSKPWVDFLNHVVFGSLSIWIFLNRKRMSRHSTNNHIATDIKVLPTTSSAPSASDSPSSQDSGL